MTSIHIYEVITCSFSNPEKKMNGWKNTGREKGHTVHGPGGKLAAELHCGVRKISVEILSLVLGGVINCALVAQLISVIPVSAPMPWPSPES